MAKAKQSANSAQKTPNDKAAISAEIKRLRQEAATCTHGTTALEMRVRALELAETL